MAKILYLEDEKFLAEDLAALLEEMGWKVKTTSSIPEALKWFREQDFDGVLLDIMMSPAEDMDAEQVDYGRETGIEIARKMHKLKPNVPLVAFTVLRAREMLSKIVQAGVVEVINKPAEFDEIKTRLQRAIGHREI